MLITLIIIILASIYHSYNGNCKFKDDDRDEDNDNGDQGHLLF